MQTWPLSALWPRVAWYEQGSRFASRSEPQRHLASKPASRAMVKSLRHAKAVAMAASAVAINAASKKGFIETAVSLEKPREAGREAGQGALRH